MAPDASPPPRCLRIGHGYDLHRLEPPPPAGRGRAFVLGSLRLEHPTGPVGHSDGDVLLHAVTDAILGALGEPDIGQLFPDDDPRFEAGDSRTFLAEAARRMALRGYRIGNLDMTVVCERPKIGPRKGEIVDAIAGVLACDPHRLNLKGKTHEGVDAVGEGRAIEAHAVVLLEPLADR